MANKIKLILSLIIFIAIILIANIVLKNKNNMIFEENLQNSGENTIQEEMVKSVTKDDFENEVLQSDKVVLIDFYATWCEPCKRLSPIISEIAKENENLKVVKIDVDEESDIANQYMIRSIPTLVIIKDGQEKDRIIGLEKKSVILDLIEEVNAD